MPSAGGTMRNSASRAISAPTRNPPRILSTLKWLRVTSMSSCVIRLFVRESIHEAASSEMGMLYTVLATRGAGKKLYRRTEKPHVLSMMMSAIRLVPSAGPTRA